MAIQYSTGTRINTTFAGDTKALIRDGIETNLLAAGWTTVSGSGTTDLIMKSGLTPQGLQICARFRDIGGTCLVGSIQNVAGTLVGTVSSTAGCFLLPGTGKVYRIVANQFQFFIHTGAPTATREAICCIVPYVPPHLEGATSAAAVMQGNANSDTDTVSRDSLRYSLRPAIGMLYALSNTTLWQQAMTTILAGPLIVQTLVGGGLSVIGAYRWHDDSAFVSDALIGWGSTASSDEAKYKGQIWDAFISNDSYTADLVTSYDSHNWIVITGSNSGSTNNWNRGTLFIAVP